MRSLSLYHLLIVSQNFPSSSLGLHAVFPPVTKAPFLPQPSNILELWAISTELSTCGYLDGDRKKKRTADSGFNCRVDTRNGLWGFCPTTVLTASDCGLAGSCVDRHDCSDGCGMTGSKDLTTFTSDRKSFCSMALLTFGVDQTYSYIACGTKATTDHCYITPTIGTTTTSESSKSTTSETSQTSSVTSSDTASSIPDITQSASTEAISSSSEEDSSSGSSSPNLGAIIGGVIGGLIVICGTIITAIFLLRRNRSKDTKAGAIEQNTEDHSTGRWRRSKTKELQELGGWNIHEMPVNEQNERRSPVELAA
ncbi:uncharacterized protein FOBCDRAFT_320435 [Fusarium oxysporum Fo47]|uniref:Uncharacterized protein n=1 Tax=Fusarium oxysporum Fo47 TaxID=660027 RepID=W9KBG7_FUSOX|nr:uncharacterized protein FOBCDRAFT_320435 [Fusarium oxysporum Fo47]EWZ39290.1 hypothetical protein FOZG_08430 [Fusarium oxysporum Fo47]QKD55729.1 hypothetical protein FOBCDRAFT_320435 [Fusarium oxysporum Fo47]